MKDKFSYDRLLYIIKNNPPYRGTTNEYPVWYRHQSYKRFKAVELGKKKGVMQYEFIIYYGYTYVKTEIKKEEYEALGEKKNPRGYSNNPDGTKTYHKLNKIPNEIGVVRFDNTFEFTCDSEYLHQGIRQYLSSRGQWVVQSIRHGGAVIYNAYRSVKCPVFKGLRIYMDTLMPHASSDYKIIKKSVNRSKAAAARKKYENSMRRAASFFAAMDKDTMRYQLKDTVESLTGSNEVLSTYSHEFREGIQSLPIKLIDEDPVGAVLACILKYNILFAVSMVNGFQSGWYTTTPPATYFYTAKEKLHKEIYVKLNAFDEEVITSEQIIPSSVWPLTVMVKGKVVEQYK